ncbi:hypothetical protein K474DRAFT_1660641 [Panus rudis PR-1116 ss-1]|nr:hypothetical protein K474DRAFT_1660641 [Panus rudis PR-1116 ss-1]
MGFFSARRGEGDATQLPGERSVAQVIRSRFYGKQAGKTPHREGSSTPYASQHASRSQVSVQVQPSVKGQPSVQRSVHEQHEHTGNPRSPSGQSRTLPRAQHKMAHTRTSTDAITITLAQRLQELATANAEGLLNDDEYRLLRQDLFDRLAGGSTVPAEAPLVPIAARNDHPPRHSRQSSQFDTQSSLAPSIQSKRSISSSVTGLLKRATSKRRTSSGADSQRSETASVYSTSSHSRGLFPRLLSRQPSNVSLQPENHRLSRADPSTSTLVDPGVSHSPKQRTSSLARSSARSLRNAPPPSAFQGKFAAAEQSYTATAPIDGSQDDEMLLTSADIRREIEAVEAESKRLLDAFNGLELSTLVRRQKRGPTSPLSVTPSETGSQSRLAPDDRMPRRMASDMDAISIHSNNSRRTTVSTHRPTDNRNRRTASHTGTVSQTSSLYRQNSVSTMSIHSRAGPTLPPPSPLVSRSFGRLKAGSSSSVNLARSVGHLPLATVAEGPDKARTSTSYETEGVGEDEMNDIRRRKAEVTARYEARIEYLRARLKGAELREKLLKH